MNSTHTATAQTATATDTRTTASGTRTAARTTARTTASGTATDHPLQPLREVPWFSVLGLAAIALVRPAIHVGEFVVGATVAEWIPFGITVVITAVWAAIVGLRRWRRPFTSLVMTGVAYAVLTVLLGGIGGALLMGGVQGPLADPLSIPGIVLTNLLWGGLAGALATLLQRALGVRVRPWRVPRPSTTVGRVAWYAVVAVLGLVGGVLAGIVATDLVGVVTVQLGQPISVLTTDPMRWVIASLVPACTIVGLAGAFPLHALLRRRGDRALAAD